MCACADRGAAKNGNKEQDMDVTEAMRASGVVAAVKDDEGLAAALGSGTKVIFLLKSDLMSVGRAIGDAHAAGKLILVHVDLTEGLGKDDAAIRYVAERLKPDGIITTRPATAKCAAACGLYVVFRVFLIDSQGLKSALANAEKIRPDAVEIMPGLLPEMVPRFSDKFPVIVGGLVSAEAQVRAGLAAGAIAASTSARELWH